VAQVNEMSSTPNAIHSARACADDAGTESPRPGLRTLDAWTAASWAGGLRIDDLEVLDSLTVRTRNSTYSLVVLNPATGEVRVRGGRICPAFEPAVLVGATAGGSVLRLRWIQPGLQMELVISGRRTWTSVVESVALVPGAADSDAC
jgi:hypothetical protein